MICDHLRPTLIRAARRSGAGDWAEDVVADVVARRFRIVVADAPITLATPHAFNHLTASLLVSVKHAAVSHGRDTARVLLAPEDELVALIDRGARQGWHSTRETNNDEVRALTEALRTLSARDAQIARLIGIHEMTVRDVAERLGIGASTVHDVWSRVQRTISVEVERVLSGDVCRQAGPHLALIGIQYRSDRAGHEDTTLGELVARVWNATTTSVARMADAIWGLVTTNPLPGTAGVATTTVGIGASKIAAVVAASALFTTTPALMSAERSSVRDGQTPPARTTSQTVTSQPSTTTRKTAATPVERSRIARSSMVTPSAPSAPLRSPAPSAPVSARSSQPAVSGAGRASAEFSPGP